VREESERSGTPPVEDAADLLLVLLFAPGKTGEIGEPVVGTTRLQKLLFLLREGEGPRALVDEAKAFQFEAYKMGPYSLELRDTVADLEAAGILQAERLDYALPDDGDASSEDAPFDGAQAGVRRVTSYRYRLSEDLGMKIGVDLWSGLDVKLQEHLTEFKRFFNSISLRQLLIFTYEKFPSYAAKSTIKEQLGF